VAENQEDRSREDLTEEASPYRIEEFRRKGIVAQSKELSGLAALLACGVVIYALTPKMGVQMAEFMRDVFRADLSAKLNLNSAEILGSSLTKALKVMIGIGLPVCLAGFVIGVIGSFAQIGSIFSMDPLQPDLSKIDPIRGIQKFFTLRQLFDGIRLIFKMVVMIAVAYAVIKTEIFKSPQYWSEEPIRILAFYGSSGAVVFLSLIGVLLIFAIIDFGLQRWEYSKNLRLTKQEAKQEYKEREGDPQIKARIRAVQREMARRRMMQAVKTADVIVTNPTHIAVAIVYEKEKMYAPKVVAKGADYLAEKIKKIASDAGVPRVENVPLARTLYKTVKVGQYVPRVLYQAVAEVLAYVYRLKNRRFG
jgi:flagellar biosynthesis protein FlhB